MSKSIVQIAQLLGADNEQLFDRYINFRLTRDEPTGKPRYDSRGFRLSTYSPDDFQVVCPSYGLKPDIQVSASLYVQNTSNLITLTVTNMSANIDTMAYNWAEVEVGYYNSGIHTSFKGQITNCYMAKPNPNGELVVNVVCANIASMFTQGEFEVPFLKEFVTTQELVETCVNQIGLKYPSLMLKLKQNLVLSLTGDWATQTFMVNKATYRFRSPHECLAWLNSLFASYTYNTGYDRGAGGAMGSFNKADKKLDLPPIRLGFDREGYLSFTGTYSDATPGAVKTLSSIGSAFLTGTSSATLTAPFNPDIAPGEVIYVDTKYFKTRVNVAAVREKYASMGNLWYVIEIQFTFSTRGTNMMTLKLNNISNKVTSEEG